MENSAPRLGQLLREAYDRLRDDIYGQLAEKGFADIRAAHSAVLRAIDPDGTRVVDLAQRADMTKQSMAYLTQSLEQAGYVVIAPDPEDGRAKRVRLTARGRKAYETLVALSAAAEARYARTLGEKNMQTLRTLLAKLNAARPD